MQFLAQRARPEGGRGAHHHPLHRRAKRPAVKQGRIVLNGILRLVGQYRPLMYFGVPGMTALLGASPWASWSCSAMPALEQLAVGYAMITVLLAMGGLLMLSTGITLHSVRALLSDLFNAFSDRINRG
jgi:hypothetical protein